MRRPLALLALLLLAALLTPRPVAARSALAWRLAPDDFVHYRITVHERTDSQSEGYARWGEIDDVAGFHGHELDREARRVPRDVTHAQLLYVPFVFLLPPHAGLGARAAIDEVLGGNWRLEPLRARGEVRVTEGEAEGSSRRIALAGDVTFKEEEGAEARGAQRRLREGRLAWTARFDLDRGLIDEVEYVLSFLTEEATQQRPRGVHGIDPTAQRFHARVRLDLERVLAYRYPGFQRDVDAAIEQGLELLASSQDLDGSWGGTQSLGLTALALLALLDGGRGAEDPTVERGFRWLLSQSPWVPGSCPSRTYSIGIALMALERRRTPDLEVDRRRRGVATDFLPRRLQGVERAWMMRGAGFLLDTARVANRSDGVRPATGAVTEERWRWRYPRAVGGVDPVPPEDDDWDNSNTQYAVLGLESAARCGVPIPERVWYGIANHFLDAQAPDGPLRRDLVIVRQRFADAEPRGRTTPGHTYAPEPVRARARGWNYRSVGEPEPAARFSDRPYGSMTVGGIASLAIARARLAALEGRRGGDALLARIDQSILDGYASLDAMFTVWTNPRYEGWYTYYLYGLERAGMLTAVERFGVHDWYWEGAVQLLLRQSDYGQGGPRHWVYDFGDVGTTSWAVLFLERGTARVLTPR